jgi:hypothetical protein
MFGLTPKMTGLLVASYPRNCGDMDRLTTFFTSMIVSPFNPSGITVIVPPARKSRCNPFLIFRNFEGLQSIVLKLQSPCPIVTQQRTLGLRPCPGGFRRGNCRSRVFGASVIVAAFTNSAAAIAREGRGWCSTLFRTRPFCRFDGNYALLPARRDRTPAPVAAEVPDGSSGSRR